MHQAGAFTFGPETRFGGMAYGKCFGHSGMAGELIVGGARSGKFATLLAYQRKILASLGEEIEKVMRDELGEVVRFPETGRPVDPDRSLGMHI